MKDNNHFLIGLLLGGVAAGVGALLMAPKSGKELINDISDTYNDIAEKTNDFKDDVKHRSWHLLHPNEACTVCNGNTASKFAAGALAGAVLGATSALLLAPKPGAKLRGDIEDTYHNIVDQGEEWKDTIGDFMHQFQKGAKRGSKIDQILQMAHVGFNIWKNLQKRK